MRVLLHELCTLVLALSIGCDTCNVPKREAVRAHPEPALAPVGDHAVCVPEPDGVHVELRGVLAGGDWSRPTCAAPLQIVPCTLGAQCNPSKGCTCTCWHDGDCRAAVTGYEHHGGPHGRTSLCVPGLHDKPGRCVWGGT